MPTTRTRRPEPIAKTLGRRLERLAARRFPASAEGSGPCPELACDVRALAEAAGRDRAGVYRIINGTRDPGFSTLEALCLACGATVADLYRVEIG